MLDGIDNNTSVNSNNIGRNGKNYKPSVDAVAEFKVKTNNYSAEFGRSAGAIISANLKSGGSDFHGSAWEFLRNEKLEANNFFSNAGGVPRQPFKQNQFGFTAGGPVLIPRVYNGRNKTFFFTDYEGLRRCPGATSPSLTIGSANFGKLTSSSATGRQVEFCDSFGPRFGRVNLCGPGAFSKSERMRMMGAGAVLRRQRRGILVDLLQAPHPDRIPVVRSHSFGGSFGRAHRGDARDAVRHGRTPQRLLIAK
jgi:hypothetical protein